jgi:hypothetical protein
MTPIEKSIELYNKMYDFSIFDESAKQCALIAVDEIIEALENNAANLSSVNFYKEVKKELEAL